MNNTLRLQSPDWVQWPDDQQLLNSSYLHPSFGGNHDTTGHVFGVSGGSVGADKSKHQPDRLSQCFYDHLDEDAAERVIMQIDNPIHSHTVTGGLGEALCPPFLPEVSHMTSSNSKETHTERSQTPLSIQDMILECGLEYQSPPTTQEWLWPTNGVSPVLTPPTC